MDDILFGRLGAYLKKRQARKGEQSLSAIDHLVMLERDPIEASSCEELIQKTSSFPRSSDRGPIESLAEGCPGELIVGRAAHLFSHVSCSGGTTAVRGDKILRNSHPLEGAVRRRATALRGGKRPTWSVWPCRRFCRMAERPASARRRSTALREAARARLWPCGERYRATRPGTATRARPPLVVVGRVVSNGALSSRGWCHHETEALR